MTARTTNILEISASGRHADSTTRALSRDLIDALERHHVDTALARRDLSVALPFVDSDWIDANSTPVEDRSRQQKATLALSDELVAELQSADILVIGAPIYNFSIPASLKAWIDQVARARLTFRYTDKGPVGLLQGKKAYLVVASGGVPVGSAADFATPYLRHALAFIGIEDVEIIAAERMNSDAGAAMDAARAKIADLVYLSTDAA